MSLRKLLAVLLVLVVALGFIACGDDDKTSTPPAYVTPVKIYYLFVSSFGWSGDLNNKLEKAIVLYNAGTNDQDLTGWTIQTGHAGDVTYMTNLSGTIAAGKYFLISQTNLVHGVTNGGKTADLVCPDLYLALSYKGKGVALVNSTTKVTSRTSPTIVDQVGFQNSGQSRIPTFYEGAYPDLTSDQNLLRNGNGATDTGSSTSDFTQITEAAYVPLKNSSD